MNEGILTFYCITEVWEGVLSIDVGVAGLAALKERKVKIYI